MKYTMRCDKVVLAAGTCWDEVDDCLVPPFRGFYHTETFDECLKICVEQHPLCRAISWNPGPEIGFANCWPKTDFNDSSLIDSSPNDGTFHSATITQIDQIDTKCPESSSYVAEKGGGES
jgi:hypothetical protein